MLKQIRQIDTKRALTVVSSGGIRSGQDALDRIKSGADLV